MLEEITNLDKKVNLDDLIYKYKGPTADTNLMNFIMLLILQIKQGKAK